MIHARRREPRWQLCVAALLALLAGIAYAESQNEYLLRAAYVFNLAKFVEWPESSNDLVVGVVGDGPMAETLQNTLASKTIGSRHVRVILSPPDESLETCDVLYVTGSSRKTRAVLDRVRTRRVLTIGETDSFTRDGGTIGLVRLGERFRIRINLDAAQSSNLKISSRLLNLSNVVVEGKE